VVGREWVIMLERQNPDTLKYDSATLYNIKEAENVEWYNRDSWSFSDTISYPLVTSGSHLSKRV
jgi:hypothetical protein